MEFYAIMPDGTIIFASTQQELMAKIKEYKEGTH